VTGWVILVDQSRDFPNAETPHKVITTRDYLARPQLFGQGRPKVINLARSYAYQSEGYYCSLLAEARGHRVLPAVESMLELGGKALYAHALPELEDALNRAIARMAEPPAEPFALLVCFGRAVDERFERFGRLLFDWFRCPAIEASIHPVGGRMEIRRLRPLAVTRLKGGHAAFFRTALHEHTKGEWRSPRVRKVPDYSLAVLFDPTEPMPPSRLASLRHMARIAEQMSVEIEPISRRDLARIAEYDALFIRETTAINNHTYRFARRAAQEGMPVIDDPLSMIRCTNKVYLHELLAAKRVPTPKTLMLTDKSDLDAAMAALGLPVVLKVPDGSFSRGVHKAEDGVALRRLLDGMFAESDLVLAQEFMPTAFDWRVGVLGGEPLFACQYLMAKKHWQIIKHAPNGKPVEGNTRAFALDQAPQDVIETAVRAARLIGDGLYGVDIKQNDRGVFVIEINDNPNLDHGVEDAAGKDQIWRRLVQWFVDRIEQ
jgi:glutathione synthase/RimK-type ligase-like ATP-grasp enzyme